MTETSDVRRTVAHSNPVTQAGFTAIPNAIMLRRDLSPAAKLIYGYLKHLAWRNGGDAAASPLDVIGADLNLGRNAVGRHVRELCQAPCIEGDKDSLPLLISRRQGLGLPNEYVINDPESRSAETVQPDAPNRPIPARARSSSQVKTNNQDPPVAPPPGSAVVVVAPANRPATVNKKPVTNDEYELAAAALHGFNEIAGTSYSSRLIIEKIVRRIREHPELRLYQHLQIIGNNFADPWWKDNPAPEVIYGNASIFERSAHKRPADENTVSPDDAAAYGTEWGPGTDFTTAAAARAARSSRFAGADVVDVEHWEES